MSNHSTPFVLSLSKHTSQHASALVRLKPFDRLTANGHSDASPC